MQREFRNASEGYSWSTIWFVCSILATFDVTALAQCGSLPGDSNNNQHVELLDYSDFVQCFAGPGATPQPAAPQTPESCLANFDSDDDLDSDLLDFAEFQVTFTGQFRPECFNLVFVSSTSFQANLGSATAYDAQCNMLASAAGLNNAVGNEFIAWVSTSNSSPILRLGAARGFVRPDGVPIADTVNALLNNDALLNPIRVDEYGNDVGDKFVITGTSFDGTVSPSTCVNWTNTAGSFSAGRTTGGPGYWTQLNFVSCSQSSLHIYCFQKTITRMLTPLRTPGKVAYLTNSKFTPGGGLVAANQLCESSKPAGTGPVRALLATPSTSAVSALHPFNTYVRVDGQLIGTVAQLANATLLHSGIWQAGNGTYVPFEAAWTGSAAFALVGTQVQTCNNWTSMNSGPAIAGLPGATQVPAWWSFNFNQNCSTPLRLYCVEQ